MSKISSQGQWDGSKRDFCDFTSKKSLNFGGTKDKDSALSIRNCDFFYVFRIQKYQIIRFRMANSLVSGYKHTILWMKYMVFLGDDKSILRCDSGNKSNCLKQFYLKLAKKTPFFQILIHPYVS